jgi:hypothetical protein
LLAPTTKKKKKKKEEVRKGRAVRVLIIVRDAVIKQYG